MVLAALAAEALDLATWNPATEQNPLVQALTYPTLVKVCLMVLIVSVAVLIGQLHRYEKARQAMLAVAVVAGCVGTLSNVL